MSLFYELQNEFRALLDTEPEEHEIQEWLESHPVAFGDKTAVIKKAPLGSEFEPDFMLVQNITIGFSWTIVELKRAKSDLFRQDDLPTNDLNSAIAQAERYQLWIMNNVSFIRQWCPQIYQPQAHVLIGRRARISQSQQAQLRHMNANRSVVVRTYDSLLDQLTYVTTFELRLHNALTDAFSEHLPKLRDNLCYNGMADASL